MIHNFNLFSIIPVNLKGLSSPVSEIMTYQNRQLFKTGSDVIKTYKNILDFLPKVFVVRYF